MPRSKDFADADTIAAGAVANVVVRLRNIEFPASREQLLGHAQRNGASEDVLDTLAYLPEERRDEDPVELFDAIGDEVRKMER